MNLKKKLLLNILLFVGTYLSAQTTFYNPNTIQKIEVFFSQPNWDYQMDTAKYGSEGYLMADSILINGMLYDSVAVKYKGNSSFDSTKNKNPLHIRLDKFKNQDYEGYQDIKLSNCYADPSFIREVLAYNILKNYMHCPLSNFATVYINGNYIGIYSNSEDIGKKFLGNHFYSSNGTFIKCNPSVNPGPTTKSNFRYLGIDSNLYTTFYEIKSKYGWSALVEFCDSMTNNTNSYENTIDVDRYLWMLAFNNLFVNLDSYNGVFAQNHYTFRDQTNHYNPIVWDLNMCFGGFPFAGQGPTSMGNQTLSSMQQFPINHHSADDYWPLIKGIQSNATWKRKYIAHIKTMFNEYISNNQYQNLANQYRTLIDNSVSNDVNKFYTYSQYQNSLTTDIPNGAYTIPGISNLLSGRATYLLSQSEFTATSPTISNITPSNPTPNYSDVITIKATIPNANNVYLGYRFDKRLKFEKATLYDDGLHNDGAANDQVYGTDIQMNGAILQYYIYAENNDAGIFAPQRAEYEFFTLKCQSVLPATSGIIVINELLAQNDEAELDEYNNKSDWLEIYNNSPYTIDLSNIYLSNNLLTPLKWKFPSDTYVIPHGYVTVWCDKDSLKQILHTNFNLNKEMGFVSMALSDGTILDSVSFYNQSADISFGRYPNGTGSFTIMNRTFGYENNNFPLNIITPKLDENKLEIYPNPTHQTLTIYSTYKKPIVIYNTMGVIMKRIDSNEFYQLDVSSFPNGVYFVRTGTKVIRFSVLH